MPIRGRAEYNFPRLACLAFAVLFLPGCSLFYRNQYAAENFLLLSDHEERFLVDTGETVERIYDGFSELFGVPGDDLGRTTILFKGSSETSAVVDLSYSPQLLGYYLPFFNLICVDTTPAWTRQPETLQQILLHEIAHHFLITRYPGAGRECWLNEGLAGNLEATLIDGDRFEYPMLNPPLLRIARTVALTAASEISLPEFLDMDWDGFHEKGKKELHYALAWSVVYFVLNEQLPSDRPLRERLPLLEGFDRTKLRGLDSEWKRFLIAYDLTGELILLSGLSRDPVSSTSSPTSPPATSSPTSPPTSSSTGDSSRSETGRLSAYWAIEQLGTLPYVDRRRALETLIHGFDAADPQVRQRSYLAFLRAAARLEREEYPDRDLARLLERERQRIRLMVKDPEVEAELRHSIVDEISGNLASDPSWMPVFIDLLEAPESEIRVVAAQGLGRADVKDVKRTILNPRFWRQAPASERRSEVEEWKLWWTDRKPVIVFSDGESAE